MTRDQSAPPTTRGCDGVPAGSSSLRTFLKSIDPDLDGPDADELEYLLEHEPKLGGFGGVDPATWHAYQSR